MRLKILSFFYICVLLIFSVWTYLYVDWNLELLPFLWYKNIQKGFWDFALNQRMLSAGLYIFVIFSLYILYFIILRLAYKKNINIKQIITILVIVIGILFFSHPALSHDIYNYIMTAKIITYYHENPWVIMPIEFIGEPMLKFVHAANKLVLYGPSWVLLSLLPSQAGGNNFLFTFILFKLIMVVSYAGLVKMIYKINQQLKNKDALLNTVFFAFNPLVLIEVISSSHNDVVMMFFVLLSFYYLLKKRTVLSVFFLLFSIGIKYATIVLIPIYLLWLMHKINREKIFLYSAVLLFGVFLLSPLREEMYPWYLIWPLSLIVLIDGYSKVKALLVALSFGLLFRYVPFMLTYSWSGYTPEIKKIVTIAPVLIAYVYINFFKRGNLGNPADE